MSDNRLDLEYVIVLGPQYCNYFAEDPMCNRPYSESEYFIEISKVI